MLTLPYLIAAFLIVALLIMSRFFRRLLIVLIQIALFGTGIIVAVAGVSMLMNNETIFEKPGSRARAIRFFTMNSARTSATGDGSLTCDFSAPIPAPVAAPTAATGKHRKTEQPAPAPSAPPTAGAPVAEEEPNNYDELMTRSFPGIPRDHLYALSKEVINSTGGWKIVKEDPRAGVIECLYTSRVLGMDDDVRITINSKSEIDVCSRSGTARPDSTSLLRYIPGDLAANLGHIKQFYEAIEPRMDAIYKAQQDKENAKKPH